MPLNDFESSNEPVQIGPNTPLFCDLRNDAPTIQVKLVASSRLNLLWFFIRLHLQKIAMFSLISVDSGVLETVSTPHLPWFFLPTASLMPSCRAPRCFPAPPSVLPAKVCFLFR
jgi:hypothetical protein